MSLKKADAMAAMQELEKLRAETHDEDLAKDIDNLIQVMRSKLFVALMEIQEFFHDRIVQRQDKVTDSMRGPQNTELEWEDAYDFGSEKGTSTVGTDQSPPNATSVEEVVINNDQGVLGLSIAGGIDRPYFDGDSSIYVIGLVPETPSHRNGRIHVGDKILSINGVSCEGKQHHEVVLLLRKNKLLQMVVEHNAVRQHRMDSSSSEVNINTNIETVPLRKINNSIGFTIAGGVGSPHVQGDDGIFITKVIDDSAAFHNGHLKVGDKILSVDGIAAEGKTHEEIVALLRASGDTVYLSIEKNAHSKALAKYSQSLGFKDSPAQRFTKTGTLMAIGHSDTNLVSGVADKLRMTDQEQQAEPVRTVSYTPLSSAKGFGITIVGPSGSQGNKGPNEPTGIFISAISQVKMVGELREGDQILAANDVDLTSASFEEATDTLNSLKHAEITLKVRTNLDMYGRYKQKMSRLQKSFAEERKGKQRDSTSSVPSSLVVRALFDYDPGSDTGLSAKEKKKNLLKVDYNALFIVIESRANKDWWEVESLKDNTLGWVPSPYRWTRLHGSDFAEGQHMGDEDGTLKEVSKKRSKSYRFARRLSFGRKKKPKPQLARCYELVEQHEPSSDNIRPVILLGPSKDEFTDHLFAEFPELFGSCVPHTTRPPREGEIDGEDYIFTTQEKMVAGIEQGDYIEAGQYLNHLYGTSFESLSIVAAEGRVCILDVSAHAIEHLKKKSIHPIVVFLRPSSLSAIQQQNPHLQPHAAKQMVDLANDVYKTFRSQFTAVIKNEDMQQTYRQIVQTIRTQSREPYWSTAGSQQPLIDIMGKKKK